MRNGYSDRQQSRKNGLEELQDILLHNDRQRLNELEEILNNADKLELRINPIVEQRLDLIKQRFPIEFQLAVEKIIERRLKGSQEELINLLYPMVGKLIRKNIAYQFQVLKEKIDEQLRRSFLGRLKARFSGVKQSDWILKQVGATSLEEVYIVKRDSGLLIGSFALQNTIDKEMIAGMLTAIKAFVEDAFQHGQEELELIQYGSYQILIQNFFNYYIAAAINGPLSGDEKQQISEKMLQFAEKELSRDWKEGDHATHFKLQQAIEKYFFGQNKGNGTHT